MQKSMLDVAYEILQDAKDKVSFQDLVDKVSSELGFTPEEKVAKIAQFYTNLSIDGRFVVLADNYWNLRERVPFDQVHIDMNDAYNDKTDDEEELDSDEEEASSGDDDEKVKELGEDDDEAAQPAAEDSYDDDSDTEVDSTAAKVKKEIGAE